MLNRQPRHRKANAVWSLLYLVLVKYEEPSGCKHGQRTENYEGDNVTRKKRALNKGIWKTVEQCGRKTQEKETGRRQQWGAKSTNKMYLKNPMCKSTILQAN